MRARMGFRLAGVIAAMVITASFAIADAAGSNDLILVSRSSSGQNSDGGSSDTRISYNGRLIAFASDASNLVPGDTNGLTDIFVHDRRTGETERVSVASDGSQTRGRVDAPMHGNSLQPAISGDGRFVTFLSSATNLDEDGRTGIFIHDRATRSSTLLLESQSFSDRHPLSADGRLMAFDTLLGIDPADTNGSVDVYVIDTSSREVRLASVDDDGLAIGGSIPSLSADGTAVAFERGLVASRPDLPAGIYVRDLVTGTTTFASRSWTGQIANGGSWEASLSADGTRVAFTSAATNLVPGDHNGAEDIFVRDLASGETIPVSLAADGRSPNGSSALPRISGDGARVLFTSVASNLVPGDTNARRDVFLRDLDLVVTTRVSLRSDGLQLTSGLTERDHALSGDGLTSAFASSEPGIVADDLDDNVDIFVAGPLLPPGIPAILVPDEGSLLEEAAVRIAGTADRGDVVTVYDDATELASAAVGPDGTWEVIAVLPAGSHSVIAIASHGGTTSGPSDARSFSLQLDPPGAPSIAQPIQGALIGAAPAVVSGTARVGATVTIREAGDMLATTVADAKGLWTTRIAFSDGPHSIDATASNDNGQGPASAPRSFSVDATPPAVPVILGPDADARVQVRGVTISGTAEPGAGIEFAGLSIGIAGVRAAADGSWGVSVDLPNGSYTMSVSAIDGAGNTSTAATRTFSVDADVTRPVLSITTAEPALQILDGTPIEGAARDDRVVEWISVRYTDAAGARTTVLASCDGCGSMSDVLWTSSPDLPPGVYDVRVIAYDGAGNASLAQSIRAIRL